MQNINGQWLTEEAMKTKPTTTTNNNSNFTRTVNGVKQEQASNIGNNVVIDTPVSWTSVEKNTTPKWVENVSGGQTMIDTPTSYDTMSKTRNNNVVNGNLVKDAMNYKSVIPSSNKNSFESSNLGIRDSLNAMGISNDRIGWDGQYVTVDGLPVMTPDKNVDGTTYANTNAIREAMSKVYKNNGENNYIADVTQAVASKGIANAVEYGANGTISIGGVPVSNTWIVDGQAYAPYSEIKKAVEQYKAQSGFKTANDVYSDYDSRTGKMARTIEDAINGYKPFSYDAETDPAYQAVKAQYFKNAQKAQADTYGDYASRTGGYGNTAAQAASQQAYYDYINELDSKVLPEMIDKAYSRYQDDYNKLLTRQAMYGSPLDKYNLEANASSQTNSMVQSALDSDYNRKIGEEQLRGTKLANDFTEDTYKNNLSLSDLSVKTANEEFISAQLQNKYLDPMLKAQLEQLQLQNEYYPQEVQAKLAQYMAQASYYGAQASGQNIENQYIGPKAQSEIDLNKAKATDLEKDDDDALMEMLNNIGK